MPDWSEQFSNARSLEDVARLQEENRAWHKQIQRKTNILMDSKLAKEINQEEYATQRRSVNEEAAECHRRNRILARELSNVRESRRKREMPAVSGT